MRPVSAQDRKRTAVTIREQAQTERGWLRQKEDIVRIPLAIALATSLVLSVLATGAPANAEAPPASETVVGRNVGVGGPAEVPRDVDVVVEAIESTYDGTAVEKLRGASWTSAVRATAATEAKVDLADGRAITFETDGDLADREVVGDLAVYTADSLAVAIEVGAGETRLLAVATDADAPNEFEFDFGLAPGETLQVDADGQARVVAADGTTALTIAPAWAYDANGTAVPTSYEARNGVLVQHVEHQGYAYPVTFDPTANCGWVTCTVYFDKSETRRIADGSIGVAAVVALCTLAGGPIAGAACLAGGAILVLWAQSAQSQNKCLKLKFLPVPPVPPYWPGTYSGGNCT